MVHSEVSQSSPEITIRPASHGDITALLELEKNAFDYDRLSKRSFKHFIDVDSAELLVASKAADSTVTGYILTLFHRGTELARIYSLAICATAQGKGLARRLLVAAEQTAIKRNCVALRLEVSVKNSKAIQLYQNSGYVIFDQIKNYYEDHETALLPPDP